MGCRRGAGTGAQRKLLSISAAKPPAAMARVVSCSSRSSTSPPPPREAAKEGERPRDSTLGPGPLGGVARAVAHPRVVHYCRRRTSRSQAPRARAGSRCGRRPMVVSPLARRKLHRRGRSAAGACEPRGAQPLPHPRIGKSRRLRQMGRRRRLVSAPLSSSTGYRAIARSKGLALESRSRAGDSASTLAAHAFLPWHRA